MPGDTVQAPAALAQDVGTGIQCPVHRVSITPCDAAELDPLLLYLHNDLAAQGDQQFPRGTLTADGRLDLCKQSLGTTHCETITRALQHNTQVRSLMLGTDAIGDAGAEAVADLASINTQLEVLYLGCNNIGPEGARALGTTLADGATNITGLWLKRNPLGPDGATSIARMLRSNQHLRVLDMVNTDLRTEGVRAIVDALCSDNKNLQSLYLSGNGLDASTAIDLARLLRDAPQIKALYLSVNRLGDAGATCIADALRHNHSLQTLELASNGIGLQGASALLDAARHSSLQNLNLGYAPSTRVLGAQANCLGDEGAHEAAKLIDASTTLRRLNLARNNMTAQGSTAITDAARRNGQLVQLILDGRLPDDLVAQMKHNQANTDHAVNMDQAMIKSVYR